LTCTFLLSAFWNFVEESTTLPLHTAQIAPGLYFLETKNSAFQHLQKVIKQ
jgi:hypothetical protein